MLPDIVVVGSGFAGSTISRKLAEAGYHVLILERRKHIAGNMYDEKTEHNIIVQKYGPHIFHTNNQAVYDFITQYGKWNPFYLQCQVDMEGKLVPSPFNLRSIDMMFPKEKAEAIKKSLQQEYPRKNKITIDELLQTTDPIIKEYADYLFDLDYRPYTAKQWGVAPEEIDISVLRRVPVRIDNNLQYFDDTWQCMPEQGFTSFFKTLLEHTNIQTMMEKDALNQISFASDHMLYNGSTLPIVYTGAIDELFAYQFGHLPYRSLRFEYKTVMVDSFQPAPVVAYPKAEGYTRITEFKKLPPQLAEGVTTYALEYPLLYGGKADSSVEPYYPIPNEQNQACYEKYKNYAMKFKNLYLCGRLAEYKYYNMDQVIQRAIEVSQHIIEGILT